MAASGTEPLSYQWLFNGTTVLAGYTRPSLLLAAGAPGVPVAVKVTGSSPATVAVTSMSLPFCTKVTVPLVLLGLVVAHIIALHEVGSNNPDGIEINENLDPKTGTPVDGIPFHPYYTVKDMVGVVVFLMVFTAIIFFAPEMGGYFLEYNNFVPADPLATPAHIAPVWCSTPHEYTTSNRGRPAM